MGGAVEDVDVDLVTRARAGDPDAFLQLVAPSRLQLFEVCRRITGNVHDAEDAMQDALVAAWGALSSFRGDAAFATWLHRIAVHAAIAVVRRRVASRQAAAVAGSSSPPLVDRVVDADAIERALHRIPTPFRTALILREVGDLSYAEIARIEGIPIQTVKSRLSRARRAVATLLEASG